MSREIPAADKRHEVLAQQQLGVEELEDLAYELREKLLRLCGTYEGAVHIGGDLSVSDILTVLFQYGLRVDPSDIANPTRDRFVLSKGHAAVCMYIAMSQRGFFDYDDIVATYGQLDSAYGMHPCKVQLPGVECSTGSLGHGLPLAVGMALAARGRGESHRVFCLLGDGETGEGSVWEAVMAARSKGTGWPWSSRGPASMRGMRATQARSHMLIWWALRWLVPSTFLWGRGSSHACSAGVSGKRWRTHLCWARMAATRSESASGRRRPSRPALWLS